MISSARQPNESGPVLISVRDTRFPLLMQLSIIISCATFVCAFPASIIVELYSSFGYIGEKAFANIRLALLTTAAVFCGLNILVNQSHWLRLASVKIYILFFCYINVVLLLNFDEKGYVGIYNESAAQYHYPIFFNYLLYCALGTHLLYLKNYRYILLAATVISACVILYFVDFDTLRIDISRYVEDANVGNYQFIGDALAISSLVLVAMFPSPLVKTALIVFIAPVLFLIGSRTSFAVYLLIALIYFLWLTRAWMILVTIPLLAIGLTYSNTIDWSEFEEKNPRMVRIFTDYEDDGSIIGRKDRDEKGWEDISNHPITGRFGGQRDIEGWGAYMHNVWSYWRQFGIVPLGLVATLYVLFLTICLLRYRTRAAYYYLSPFLVGLFLLIESAISRSFAFGYIHLFFGMLIAFQAWYTFGDEFYTARSKRPKRRKRRRTQSKSTSLST